NWGLSNCRAAPFACRCFNNRRSFMATCSCHQDGHTTRPTDILKQEHRVIERVLDALERMMERDAVEKQFMLLAIDFFRNFADGCHHAKEEEALFPMLERAGVPRDGGPIGVMLHEHDLGRMLIRTMLTNLDAAAAGGAGAIRLGELAARQFIAMLRAHIQKEDNVLFAMADHVLNADRQRELMSSFECKEHSQENGDKHERYLALADQLCERAMSAATRVR